MGLDQYAFVRKPNNKNEEFAYWRKHNRLQGWMEKLWLERKEGKPLEDKFIDALSDDEYTDFNCTELPLTEEDIDRLEKDINERNLPATHGFFYGNDSYEDYENEEWGYKGKDLEFIEKAREYLKNGDEIFYTCWW